MGGPRKAADAEERSLADVRARLIRAAREQAISVHVALDAEDDAPLIPGDVAAAFVGAAVQAVANSVEHAGGRGMAVGIGRPAEASDETPAIRVRVTDAGSGFDLDAVPEDRLGIKASIVARVASVGGRAIIDSGPHGTLITLVWMADE
jgi:signal transduction histidine kinase